MSEIRIEQYAVAGFDGRSVQAMPSMPFTANAVILAAGALPLAMTDPLDPKTRMLFIRCEGASARVAVGVLRGTKSAVEAVFTTGTAGLAGASLNDTEERFFALPAEFHGKDDVRVVVVDRV